jgi:pimeloyl-ACP methyl ester carboxylesterase
VATSRWVRKSGVQIHYLDHGGCAGPPLVCLHGLTANAWSFEAIVSAGIARVRKTVCLDLRGRGLSDRPASGYGLADHAGDVLAVLDEMGAERVVLCGHSFGGLLSLYMARIHPERVERLVLLDIAGPAVQNPATMDLLGPSIKRLGQISPSMSDFLAAMRRMPFLEGAWNQAIESYYRADVEERADGSVVTRSTPEAIGQVIAGIQKEDWSAHVAGVKQPVLLLHALGPYGPAGTPPLILLEQAEATRRDLADCQYAVVPGNHMTMLFGDGALSIARHIESFVGGASLLSNGAVDAERPRPSAGSG